MTEQRDKEPEEAPVEKTPEKDHIREITASTKELSEKAERIDEKAQRIDEATTK